MSVTTTITAKWMYPVSSPPIEDGFVCIADGKITAVDHQKKFSAIHSTHIIDFPHHIVMPGLVNAHTHLELSALKGKVSPSLPFTGWIKEIVSHTQQMQETEFREAARVGLDELIAHGVTTVADISLSASSSAVLKERNVRGIVFHEVVGFQKKEVNNAIHSLVKRIEDESATELVRIGISPHAVYSVSPLLIQKTYAIAKEHRFPFAMHIAETLEEENFLYGKEGDMKDLLHFLHKWDEGWNAPKSSPFSYLNELETMEDLLAIHCNYPEVTDMSILKKNKASVVFCPLSNRWFDRTVSYPLMDFLKEGITVCLGTDSLASNDGLNLFNEMNEVKRLFPDLAPEKILEMATINGAIALSSHKVVGDISVGKDADIIAIDAKEVTAVSDIASYLVSGQDRVVLCMVKGRRLF